MSTTEWFDQVQLICSEFIIDHTPYFLASLSHHVSETHAITLLAHLGSSLLHCLR